MAQQLKLGYKASAEQFAPRELVEIAVAAEEHGMDSVAVSDHFQPWRHNGGHAPFSLSWMAAVGERTPPGRLVTAPLPAGVVADVGLADLIAFYDNPARGFLRDRLQVGVSHDVDEVSDRLPVDLDALEKWAVGDRALRARIAQHGMRNSNCVAIAPTATISNRPESAGRPGAIPAAPAVPSTSTVTSVEPPQPKTR